MTSSAVPGLRPPTYVTPLSLATASFHCSGAAKNSDQISLEASSSQGSQAPTCIRSAYNGLPATVAPDPASDEMMHIYVTS